MHHHRTISGGKTLSKQPNRRLERLTDTDLVDAYREGSSEAAAELYKRYYLKLVRGVSLKLPSLEAAEDCVNSAFLKVFDIIRRGKGPSTNFYGYLRSTVVRESIDFYAGRSPEVQFDDFADRIDEQVSVSDEYTQIDTYEIQAALQTLPDNWGQLIKLRYVENMKPADIAKLLGTEVSALRKMLYRAKNGLRDAYLKQVATSRNVGSCRRYSSDIVDHVTGRPALSEARVEALQSHLITCAECKETQAELLHQWRRVSPEALGLALLIGGSATFWGMYANGGDAIASAAVQHSDPATTATAASGKTAAVSQTTFGAASKTMTIGGVFQSLGLVGASSVIALIAAGVVAAIWLHQAPNQSSQPRALTSANGEPHRQTISTADGHCELNVSTASGKLEAEAIVYSGKCWFTYQRTGGATRNEARVHTGWLLLTKVSGTYDLKLRSEKEATQIQITI